MTYVGKLIKMLERGCGFGKLGLLLPDFLSSSISVERDPSLVLNFVSFYRLVLFTLP